MPPMDLPKGNFDKTWTHYENVYVVELMVIENDARRFIIEAL